LAEQAPVDWLEYLSTTPIKPGWETLAAVATVAAAFFALVALVGVTFQIRASRSIEREAIAHQIWRDYLVLAFENPNFAAPNLTKIRAEGTLEKYEWFVSVMLYGAEQILMSRARSRPWKNVIRDQIRYHYDYITTDQFQNFYLPHYSDSVKEVIGDAISAGRFDPA
jgi:hypothetical protein